MRPPSQTHAETPADQVDALIGLCDNLHVRIINMDGSIMHLVTMCASLEARVAELEKQHHVDETAALEASEKS